MKTILTIILAVFSLGGFAQIAQDSTEKRTFVESEYFLIDTVTKLSSGNVDTVRYSELVLKKDLPKFLVDILPIIPNNDTIYKLTNSYRLDFLHSAKIVVYRRVDKFVMVSIERKPVLKMIDYLKKRKQLNYPINNFWELPQIIETTNQ